MGEESLARGLSDHRSLQFWSVELGNKHGSTWQMGESTDGLLVFLFIGRSPAFVSCPLPPPSSPFDFDYERVYILSIIGVRGWFGGKMEKYKRAQASFQSSLSTVSFSIIAIFT